METLMQLETTTTFDGTMTSSHLTDKPAIGMAKLPGWQEAKDQWTPPHAFVASVESCFFLTMLDVAAKMRVGITGYRSSASGRLVTEDGRHKQVDEIVIRPEVELANEADRKKLPKLFQMAEEYCLVARSLKTKIVIEA